MRKSLQGREGAEKEQRWSRDGAEMGGYGGCPLLHGQNLRINKRNRNRKQNRNERKGRGLGTSNGDTGRDAAKPRAVNE